MKKSLSILALVLACAFLAPASAAAVGVGSISGTITDASSGLPVEGAEACAYGEFAPSSCSLTDASGAYSITGLVAGQYKVWFGDEGDGYLSQYYDEAEYWTADPVMVSTGATTSGIDAALVKAGAISGTVTDAGTGEPIAGIHVCAEVSFNSSCEETGADGTYAIGGLRQGSYRVEFRGGYYESGPDEYELRNYVPQYFDGKTWNDADLVPVTAGSTTPGIDVAMAQGALVAGTVTDGTEGLEEVKVCAYRGPNGTEAGCGRTDSTGDYLLFGLPSGNYRFGFFPEDSVHAPQYFDGKTTLQAADFVALTAGAETNGIDAVLPEAGKISGTVTKAGGGAIQGLSVCATGGGGPGPPCASTDAEGKYTIGGLSEGEYTVRFQGGFEYLSQYYSGATSFGEATRVAVENGVTTTGIDAQMHLAGQIKGKVTTTSPGGPVSNVQVCAATTTGSYGSGTPCSYTDAEGNYTIGDLEAGAYDVRFTPGYGEIAPGEYGPLPYLVQYYEGAVTRSEADPVTVSEGAVSAGINATLQTGGTIAGTVVDAASGDGVEAQVCAMPTQRGGSERCATSHKDGTYAIRGLRSGDYKVRFSSWASTIGYLRQYYDGKAHKKEADPVAVTAGNITAGIDAAMHQGGKITGTVTDADSHAPVAGIEVCATGYCDETGSDGTYELKGLTTGSFRVHFYGRDETEDYAGVYYHDKPSWEEAQKVAVTAGQVTSGIDQEMHVGGRITGTVVAAAGGDPLEQISVCAWATDGEGACDHTDEAGTYEIAGLSPGSYAVRFSHANSWPPGVNGKYVAQYFDGVAARDDATPVSVGFGDTAAGIDAAMEEGGSIAGTVTAASNHAPLIGIHVCATGEDEGEEGLEHCTFSDADGEYLLEGLGTGSYLVSFYPGFLAPEPANLLPQYFDGSATRAGADQVAVTVGSTTSDVDAEILVGGQISGTITAAADGSQLEGITACAYGTGGEGEGSYCASSNGHGEYTIARLPADTYKVRFSAITYDWEEGFFEEEAPEPQPEEEFLTQYWKGVNWLGAASAIVLTPGGSVGGIDAQMVVPSDVPPPPPSDGGGSSGGGTSQPGTGMTLPASPPMTLPRVTPKRVHCRKGFKKKRVHGRVRCVKVHKHAHKGKSKKHRRSR